MAQLERPGVALVTGATGFVGRVLCEHLRDQGVRVYALVRERVPGPWDDTVVGDITRGALPAGAMQGVDAVFHLAARVHALDEATEDEAAYSRVNVEGTKGMLMASIDAGAKAFVFFSSVKAMGEGSEICLDEKSPCHPVSAYGRSKLEAEQLVMEMGVPRGLHVVNLRLPLVYGKGSKGNLYRMLEAVATGRFPPIKDIGNKRSMVHVEDAAAAALVVAGSPQAAGQTYIVTDGAVYSTREIYSLMCEALGKKLSGWSIPIQVLRSAALVGDVFGWIRRKRFVFDSDALNKLTGSSWYSDAKIRRELNYSPRHDLPSGLKEMAKELIA